MHTAWKHHPIHAGAPSHSQMTFQLQVKLLLSRLCWAVSLCHGVWHEEDGEEEEEKEEGLFFVSAQVQPAMPVRGRVSAVSAPEPSLCPGVM